MSALYNLCRTLLISITLSLVLQPFTAHTQDLISSEYLYYTGQTQVYNIQGIPSVYDIRGYKLVYSTTDVHGDSTVASGLIVFPGNANCDIFPMGVFCHGTVLRKDNIPSELNFTSNIVDAFASSGYIMVAPDYLGYGESPLFHPYLHSESQATATIDMIQAAREFLESRDLKDNHEVYITGYSQGGHAAMGTMEYAEENDLTEELGIIAGAPCSGAYDLSEITVPPLVYDDVSYPFLGFAVYAFFSYNEVYGNIYQELDDFYKEEYIDDIEKYFDGSQNQYSISFVNDQLPNKLSQLMLDSALNKVRSNNDHPFWQAFRDNDNYDWRPDIPIRLLYCDGDEIVNYMNSTKAEITMRNNGAEDVKAINVQPGANHGQCLNPALLRAYEFFDSLSSPCETTAATVGQDFEAPDVYPNPAGFQIHITNLQSVDYIRFFNSRGMEMSASYFPDARSSVRISLKDIPPGMYFLQFYGEDGSMGGKKVIVK